MAGTPTWRANRAHEFTGIRDLEDSAGKQTTVVETARKIGSRGQCLV